MFFGKRALRAIGAITAAAVVAVSGSNYISTAQDARTLTVWVEGAVLDSFNNADPVKGAYGKYLVEQFQKENPGVTVKLEYHGWDEELRQNLLTALMGGTGPDIVVGESYFLQYADLGALLDVTDALTDVKDNMVEGTYAGAFLDNKIYGVAGFTGVFGFERNCSVIEAAGLDCENAPATWDELLAQAKTINEKGAGAYHGYTLQGPAGYSIGSVFRVAVYLAQAGSSLCKDDCTKPNYNDPKSVPVYEFLREINRYTPPGLTFNTDEGMQYSQLFKGVSAYQIAGSWHPSWARDSACADCRYSSVPIPEGGEAASLVVGNVIYAGLAQTKNPDLVKAYLKFLVSDGAQDLAYSSLGRLPSTRSALQKMIDNPEVDAATKSYADVVLNSKNLLILPQWRKDPQKLWTIWNEAFTKVLTTEDPIQGILDEAQAQADALFAP